MLGLGLGDWVSVKVRFGWRIREVPYLQIQGEIYTHSELLRTSGVRRGVGVNESVKKGVCPLVLVVGRRLVSQGKFWILTPSKTENLGNQWCS